MKTSVVGSESISKSISSEALTPIAVAILDVRYRFLDHLNSLAKPFNQLATNHYLSRLVRAEERHMLGEYIPFLLGDLLGIPNSFVSDISVPWLILYEHALLIDDLTDRPMDLSVDELLLSQVLFDSFVTLWKDRFSDSPRLWSIFSAYHTEAVAAALNEQKQISIVLEKPDLSQGERSDDTDLSMGRKAALVKFCAAALSTKVKQRFLNPSEEAGIDKLCAGIQLLDDLSDSSEDYREHRYSYPVQLGLEWLQFDYEVTSIRRRELSDLEIICVLLVSGVTAHFAARAAYYLGQGLADLEPSLETPTAKHLLSLIENARAVQTRLDDIGRSKSNVLHAMIVSLCKGEENLRQLLREKECASTWTEMKNYFRLIATASN